jgi:hypothetical protein
MLSVDADDAPAVAQSSGVVEPVSARLDEPDNGEDVIGSPGHLVQRVDVGFDEGPFQQQVLRWVPGYRKLGKRNGRRTAADGSFDGGHGQLSVARNVSDGWVDLCERNSDHLFQAYAGAISSAAGRRNILETPPA